MTDLVFPSSPVNGQVYEGFVYDSTPGIWRVRGTVENLAGVSGVTGTVATTTDGDATIYSFTGDGTITVSVAGMADILLVGGGGAGGHWGGGGGGAGGVLYLENVYLPAGSLDVVVGSGGSGVGSLPQYTFPGANGQQSSIWKYSVPGGGGGGHAAYLWSSTNYYSAPQPIGASTGGKAVYNSGSQGTSTPGITGIGNAGGLAFGGTSGGGGGAGEAGHDAVAGVNGNGGDGISNSITGSAVIYGGGGAGIHPATGGAGGGGSNGPGTDGLGGGGAATSGVSTQHAGGSGIVIVRIG